MHENYELFIQQLIRFQLLWKAKANRFCLTTYGETIGIYTFSFNFAYNLRREILEPFTM